MGNILVPLGIIVGLSILSWIIQQVKAAQEEQKRQQAAPPQVRRTGPKTGGSDIDRFLQEIDKLRQGGKPTPPKAAPRPPEPKAKPAPQAKKVRLADQDQPTFKTTAAPAAPPRPTPPRPAPATSAPSAKDDLPVATVVGPASGRPAPATIAAAGVSVATIATIARPTDAGYRTAKSPIAAKVTGMLADPQSAALAVVLNEILGPPKCKRG